jgi:DNA-binding SARP family transcriptional activator
MVTLDGIEQALWGGSPPGTARAQIQADISGLRRIFRESAGVAPITTRPGGYEFNLHGATLDVDQFAEQVRGRGGARLARCGEAATHGTRALARAALAGVEAAFAEPARLRLDEQRLTAIERLAEAELRAGRHDTVVPELTEHVQDHPYREHLRGQLMLALLRSGRRADALASARGLRSVPRPRPSRPGEPHWAVRATIARATSSAAGLGSCRARRWIIWIRRAPR